MSFNFPPKGWALCNGQLLPINQNQALFSLLGTTYGGDGRTNFALPNLGGRVPIHFGSGLFGPPVNLGEQAGEVNHTLLDSELPGHGHYLTVQSKPADAVAASAGNSLLAQGSVGMYGESVGTALNPSSIGNTGGSQPHTNMQPYLTLSFCIALQGIFPSQN
ncbi:MAG TPA: tail fiber protein [Nevskia sp.]|nr:tail fiber protein [Nevskia sp.]